MYDNCYVAGFLEQLAAAKMVRYVDCVNILLVVVRIQHYQCRWELRCVFVFELLRDREFSSSVALYALGCKLAVF